MDFKDTPEEAAFRKECRDWLEANHPQPLERGEDRIAWGKKWQKKKQEAGWSCLTWPKEYGGRGATTMQSIIFNEEQAKYGIVDVFGIGTGICAPTLMAFMTDDDKKRFLPKLASGEEIWCQLFSEPGAGSDLAALSTRAIREGDEWVVNGQKIWTSGGYYSDWGILVTRTDPTVPKHKGMTYFYVNMRSPGMEVKRIKQISGDSEFCEVYFTDVRIPDSQRLGAVGEGWKVALHTLMNERASLGGGGGGRALNFQGAVRLAKDLEINGRPAIEDRAVRDQLATWYTQETGLKYTSARTRTALSQGKTPGPENSIGKLVAAKKTQDMASFCIDMLDMAGGSMDPDVVPGKGLFQYGYLSAPGSRLAGGTDEIMLNILSERVLGLPQDVRVDKKVPFNEVPRGPK